MHKSLIGGIAAALLLFAASAQAQTVVYVSSTGDDANDCSRATPCRMLQRGIDQVAARGEVQIVDAGTFGGGITINKSVTISAVGVGAAVGSMVIDAPTIRVALRGLHLNGRNTPSGPSGIFIG